MKDETCQKPASSLVGLFFHSLLEGRVLDWQGQVVGILAPDYCLVRLNSWADGLVSTYRVVPLSEMVKWKFYDDETRWREEGQKGVKVK